MPPPLKKAGPASHSSEVKLLPSTNIVSQQGKTEKMSVFLISNQIPDSRAENHT